MIDSKPRTLARALLLGLCALGAAGASAAPKYVFYFIGDGMASPQIHATEAYLGALQQDDAEPGGTKSVALHMSQFPVQGMQTSYANDRLITGSAAAGTALACGLKTNIGVIAMDPSATQPYTTLAELAKRKGMKVGIISSVSLDHATPAVFYAHESSRNNYEQIDQALLASDFDYFAGGGLRVNKWQSEQYADLSNAQRYTLVREWARARGFQYADDRATFDALAPGLRTIAINPYLDGSNAIPYALNRKAGDYPGGPYEGSISLAEFTAKGIAVLDGPQGFFMMIEGGKIDWAAHANDARAAIEETIAFDDAIRVAADFGARHPDETLIVVTGDHECGGMTLGFAGTAYDTYFEVLAGQQLAYDDFDDRVFEAYLAQFDTAPPNIDATLWGLVSTYFGLDGARLTETLEDDLSDYELGLLEAAYDKTAHNHSDNAAEADTLLYGGYNPFSVTLTHLLNRRAGIAWTSYSHTAVPVPVLATGAEAWRFGGYYDNTEVARRIAAAMRVELDQ
ncbi:alkaline phosphatase [Marichromatium sp. PS1]|uniref:alkaline phosphatase n=1 Tax=Marichromatium sp. PS1 TaxID=3138932 RepID=UPI0032E6087B